VVSPRAGIIVRIHINAPALKRLLHHLAGTGRKGYSGDGQAARRAELSGPKVIKVKKGAV